MAVLLRYPARLVPSRTALAALVGVAWAISFGAARDFVWADLREGLISLRGLSRPTRALVWIGFVLLGAMLVALLLHEQWRASSTLVALSSAANAAGRGATLPAAVIPLTLFLMAMGWSFLLTGALHASRWVKLGVLAVYLTMTAAWINSTDGTLFLWYTGLDTGSGLLRLLGGWALLLMVPGFFLLRRRAETLPAVEFSVLLLIVSATLLLAQDRALESWRTMGSPELSALLQANLQQLSLLALPLLLLIGVDLALLTRQVGVWTTELVRSRLSHVGAVALLVLALGGRLWQVLGDAAERVAREGVWTEALQYGRAASIPLLVAGVWWAVTRWGHGEEDDESAGEALTRWVKRHALLLILLFLGVQVLSASVSSLLLSLPRVQAIVALQQAWIGAGWAQPLAAPWQTLLAVAALLSALWLARRGRRSLALYLGIFGLLFLWWRAVRPGGVLEALGWSGSEPEDFWWVTILTGCALVWALRGRLTPARVTGLLSLAAMTWLLRQTALLDDPYSPFFFGYTSGMLFLAVGIVWDMLTAGSWANETTPRLPRVSRVLLYVGYVLLTVTVVHWALASQDLFTLSSFTGDGALVGLQNFGKPLLFAVFATLLAGLAREARPAAPAEA